MLHDIVMIMIIACCAASTGWAIRQILKAEKEGRLHAISGGYPPLPKPLPTPPKPPPPFTTRKTVMDDSDRIDWLAANPYMVQGVFYRMQSQGGTLREAIDFLAGKKSDPA